MAKATKASTTKSRATKAAAKPSTKTSRAKSPKAEQPQDTAQPEAATPPQVAVADVALAAADESQTVTADQTPDQIEDQTADQTDGDDAFASDEPAGNELKKRELLDAVVQRTGVKKRDAKLVIEAMLTLLAEAIAEGRELNLEPMGKLKTNRVKDTENGRITIMRLKQGSGSNETDRDKEPLAEAED